MGRPSGWGVSREQRERMWQWHREGISRRTIAARLGKNPGTIHGLILEAGGIPPRQRVRSDHHLSLEDRQVIERGTERGESLRTIARWVGCAPSTISREVTRHGGRAQYEAERADLAAWHRGRRPKLCRLATQDVPAFAGAAGVARDHL